MFPAHIINLAQTVLAAARAKNIRIVTAESCTGGLVAGALTEIAGSSDVFERGFVTYSNDAKQQSLGVPADTLREHGAVSIATAMAGGAIIHSHADVSVAITGVAGPGGGSEDKPVGFVCFAVSRKGQPTFTQEKRFGDAGRTTVRLASVEVALHMLNQALS
jgi:nicotinamide-nucleotide amidase